MFLLPNKQLMVPHFHVLVNRFGLIYQMMDVLLAAMDDGAEIIATSPQITALSGPGMLLGL